MITHNLGFGTIYECVDKAEALALWKKDESKRPFIWLTEEIELCMLCDSDKLKQIYKLKMSKPGTIIKKSDLG